MTCLCELGLLRIVRSQDIDTPMTRLLWTWVHGTNFYVCKAMLGVMYVASMGESII